MSASTPRTEHLGEVWGRVLEEGDVVLLTGDLGAGKTTLTRGLATGLGVEAPVKSPTFAIHLSYPGRLTLHHLDLYRISEPRDLDELGLEDWMGRQGVTVVEWGEHLDPHAPVHAIRIRIEDEGESARRLQLDGPADRILALARAAGCEATP